MQLPILSGSLFMLILRIISSIFPYFIKLIVYVNTKNNIIVTSISVVLKAQSGPKSVVSSAYRIDLKVSLTR